MPCKWRVLLTPSLSLMGPLPGTGLPAGFDPERTSALAGGSCRSAEPEDGTEEQQRRHNDCDLEAGVDVVFQVPDVHHGPSGFHVVGEAKRLRRRAGPVVGPPVQRHKPAPPDGERNERRDPLQKSTHRQMLSGYWPWPKQWRGWRTQCPGPYLESSPAARGAKSACGRDAGGRLRPFAVVRSL